jgi:hypothetical protein
VAIVLAERTHFYTLFQVFLVVIFINIGGDHRKQFNGSARRKRDTNLSHEKRAEFQEERFLPGPRKWGQVPLLGCPNSHLFSLKIISN